MNDKQAMEVLDQVKSNNEIIKDFSKTVAEKLTDVHNRIDEIEAKGNRLGNQSYSPSDDPRATAEQKEYHNLFLNSFVRKGNENGLYDAQNAMSGNSGPDGGFAIPMELDRNIDKILRNDVAMRRISNVITGGIGYHKLVSKNNTASGWVGDTDSRPETGTPQLLKLTPYFGEIYANPAVSQNSLDDIFFDVESFLQESISEEFVSQEGTAFISGDGIKRPRGILSFPTATISDATRTFGTIETIKSGDASAFPAVTTTFSPFDVLTDMTTAIKAKYRSGACWLMNKKTFGYLQKIKTTLDGEYVLREATASAPATVLGYAVNEDENMPDIGAGALPIAFGNFKKAYTIVDIGGTRMLRDPFTNKPFVSFYTTKRTGGFLNNSEAVKLLLIGA